MDTVSIDKHEFPVLLSIFVRNSFNMDKLKSHGYSSIFELFIGATNGYDNFGKSFDWSGNNSNIWGKYFKGNHFDYLFPFKDILEECLEYKQLSQVVSAVKLKTCNKLSCGIDINNTIGMYVIILLI